MNLEWVKLYNYYSFWEQLDYVLFCKLIMSCSSMSIIFYCLKRKEVYNMTRHLLLITSIFRGRADNKLELICIQSKPRTQTALLLVAHLINERMNRSGGIRYEKTASAFIFSCHILKCIRRMFVFIIKNPIMFVFILLH